MKKLSYRDEQRLRVIRSIVGTDAEFTAGVVTARCAVCGAVAADILTTLGAQLAGNNKSLGHYLKRHQGAVVDGFRLSPRYDRKVRSWRYEFVDISDEPADWLEDLDAIDAEQRIEAPRIAPSRKALENAKQIERADARIERVQSEARLEKEVQQFTGLLESTKQQQYLTGAARVLSDGRIKTELLLDRNGEPIPAGAPAPKQPEPVKPEVQRPPPGRVPKINIGGKWREMTAAEYEASTATNRILQAAAVHPGHCPLSQSDNFFFDPGGVVTASRSQEFSTRRWSQDL